MHQFELPLLLPESSYTRVPSREETTRQSGENDYLKYGTAAALVMELSLPSVVETHPRHPRPKGAMCSTQGLVLHYQLACSQQQTNSKVVIMSREWLLT